MTLDPLDELRALDPAGFIARRPPDDTARAAARAAIPPPHQDPTGDVDGGKQGAGEDPVNSGEGPAPREPGPG